MSKKYSKLVIPDHQRLTALASSLKRYTREIEAMKIKSSEV